MKKIVHTLFVAKTFRGFVSFWLFLIALEFLSDLIVVYVMPDMFLVCDFKTTAVYFEGKSCANATIGFLYVVIHPIVLMLLLARLIYNTHATLCSNEYHERIYNKGAEINFKEAIAGILLAPALLIGSIVARFVADPYDKSASRYSYFDDPSCYLCKFVLDALLTVFESILFITFFITIFIVFYQLQYKRGKL